MYKKLLYKCPIQEIQYTQQVQKEPIDIVYTWVDSTDSEWKQKKNKYKPEYIEEIRFPNEEKPDLELETSLLFTLTNLTWIRTVYIVTMRPQIPQCLHKNKYLKLLHYSNKIKIIHHDQLDIPLTFNSNVIECYLHNIKGLSENFIYMNDDFYILKKVPYSFFFHRSEHTKKSVPITINRTRLLINFYPKNWLNIYTKSIANTIKKLQKKSFCQKHHALPYTLNRTFCKQMEKKYQKHITINNENKFRTPNDFIFYLVVYNEGLNFYKTFQQIPFKYKFVNDTQLPENIIDYAFLCMNNINDTELKSQVEILKKLLLPISMTQDLFS